MFFCIENQMKVICGLNMISLLSFLVDGIGFVRFVMGSYGNMFWKPAAILSSFLGLEGMCTLPEHCESGIPCRG